MHGVLRCVFYALLFRLTYANVKSPLRGVELYEQTDPALFRPYGLIDLLGIPYLDPEVLSIVATITGVAMLFAAMGFLSRTSAIVTAIGFVFLHGMYLGSNSLNHYWFLSMYAVVALCFTRTNDQWSVDYYIKEWRGTLRESRPTLADTGLARKVFLVLTVGFYFGAGISKLFTAGPIWANGHLIAYFATVQHVGPISTFVAENYWLCNILGGLSFFLEVGAPLALIGKKTRMLFILGWTGMHLGIWLSVGPKYWGNILCFCLLIDWGGLARSVKAQFPRLMRVPWRMVEQLTLPSALSKKIEEISAQRASVGAMVGTFLLVLVSTVSLGQVFWWPLTNVYMYCSYFSFPHDIRADYPTQDYQEVVSAQAIARSYWETMPPIEATEYFSFLFRLRFAGDDTEPLEFSTVPGVSSRKQWILTVARPVLIEDFATKPQGRIAFDPLDPDYPAQRLLRQYLPILRKHLEPEVLEQYDRVELTYPLKEGRVAIASVSLAPNEP